MFAGSGSALVQSPLGMYTQHPTLLGDEITHIGMVHTSTGGQDEFPAQVREMFSMGMKPLYPSELIVPLNDDTLSEEAMLGDSPVLEMPFRITTTGNMELLGEDEEHTGAYLHPENNGPS